MAFVTLTCPACGAQLQVNDSRDTWFCQYCGSKVEREKKYVEVSGNVTIAGIATVNSLLERGFMELDDGNFSVAESLFERVLDAEPKNWKAYLGRLLSKNELNNEEQLSQSLVPLTKYDDFNKTIKYAPEADKNRLNKINEKVTAVYQIKKAKFDENVRLKQAGINTQKQVMREALNHAESMNKIHVCFRKCKVLYIIILIVSAVAVLFTLQNSTGTTKIVWVILLLLSLALLLLMTIFKNKSTSAAANYQQERAKYDLLVADLNRYVSDNSVYI